MALFLANLFTGCKYSKVWLSCQTEKDIIIVMNRTSTAKVFKYTVIYNPEPEGGFTVTVPTLPGCVTYGRDLYEAKKMAKEAITLYIESLQKHKEKIPSEDNHLIGSIDLELPSLNA